MRRLGTEPVTLRTRSGVTLTADVAVGPDARGAGVIVLPDAVMPRATSVDLVDRFVRAGHHTIAIDVHGHRADVEADVGAARALLHRRAGPRRFVTVGIGSGGAQSLLAASEPILGLAGAVAVSPPLRGLAVSPVAHAAAATIPVLGIFAGRDALAPHEDVAALAAALGRAGVEHELVTYVQATRAFFARGDHVDAWERILEFLAPMAIDEAA